MTLVRVVGDTDRFPSRGSTDERLGFAVSVDGRKRVLDMSSESPLSVASGSEFEVDGVASVSSIPPNLTGVLGFHPTHIPAQTMHTSS